MLEERNRRGGGEKGRLKKRQGRGDMGRTAEVASHEDEYGLCGPVKERAIHLPGNQYDGRPGKRNAEWPG